MAPSVEEIRMAQRAQGPATVLAIGTAVPVNCFYQADFPDYFFRVTKSEHMTNLKDKFKRICQKSMIEKRYMHLTEEMIKEIPSIGTFKAPSFNARQEIVIEEVPKLGEKAALKAIKEWGQPKSKLTHLVFCTTSCVHMPGVDFQLGRLLGLSSSIKRMMVNHHGCYGGGTALRIAKELAENNVGARVLVVCSEITTMTFHGPSEEELGCLVGQALFSDGAAAVIVGSDIDESIERPLFQLVSAVQNTIPDSEHAIEGLLRELGLLVHLDAKVPDLIANDIEKIVTEAFVPVGVEDWNSVFWVVHAGGRAILDRVEEKLSLKDGKLDASRGVLRNYGNMASACLLFVLDEMRNKSVKQGKATTGDGLEWGVLLGFGPGITVEAILLHSVPTSPTANSLNRDV